MSVAQFCIRPICLSRGNKKVCFSDCDVNIAFVRLLKTRLKINLDFYKSINNVECRVRVMLKSKLMSNLSQNCQVNKPMNWCRRHTVRGLDLVQSQPSKYL